VNRPTRWRFTNAVFSTPASLFHATAFVRRCALTESLSIQDSGLCTELTAAGDSVQRESCRKPAMPMNPAWCSTTPCYSKTSESLSESRLRSRGSSTTQPKLQRPPNRAA